MLFRLVRTRLAPYKGPIAIIVVLQLIGTLAMLYLPSINAEIITPPIRPKVSTIFFII